MEANANTWLWQELLRLHAENSFALLDPQGKGWVDAGMAKRQISSKRLDLSDHDVWVMCQIIEGVARPASQGSGGQRHVHQTDFIEAVVAHGNLWGPADQEQKLWPGTPTLKASWAETGKGVHSIQMEARGVATEKQKAKQARPGNSPGKPVWKTANAAASKKEPISRHMETRPGQMKRIPEPTRAQSVPALGQKKPSKSSYLCQQT